MQRRRIRLAAALATAALAVAPLAAPMSASAAAPKNSHFTIGHGFWPTLALWPNGTAQVAWVKPGADGVDDEIQYCRVARVARSCADLQTFTTPYEIASAPQLLLPNPATVLIVYYLYAGTEVTPSDQTWLLKSVNGGETFAPPVLIGTHDTGGGAALGAGNTIYTVNDYSTYGVSVQRDALDGSAVPADQVETSFTDEYGGNVVTPADGSVLVSHWDETDGVGTVNVSRYLGVGDANSSTSWTNHVTVPGEDSQLVTGKKGTYLFWAQNAPDDPRFEISHITATTASKGLFITPAKQSNEQPTFWEDAAGRLNLAYWQDDQMLYRSSTMKGWATVEKLSSSGGYHQRGATAADGGGFVAYDGDEDTGVVSLVPIPVLRTITEGIHSGKLVGKVLPALGNQTVQLQQLIKGKWVLLKTTATKKSGAYSFTLPPGKRTLRAVAPVFEGYAVATGVAKKH